MIALLLVLAQTPTVSVTGGRVAGVVVPSGIREFRGIPFAAPPVGPLRWKAPQPVVPWGGVKDASEFGPRCMQHFVFSDMNFRSPGFSEDCLTLNIWAPPHATKKRPVLLYFYGGGYIAGDASEFRYDGEAMARRGIIVVTVNYRLGIFGFLSHPELTAESPQHASGNYALLDQVAALKWVRNNIAAFGGDPSHITIGGESAGSVTVNALMVSPLSRHLIAGAIGESGGLLPPTFVPLALDSAEQIGLAFGRKVGAPTLEALRAMPAAELLDSAGSHRFPLALDGWFFTESPATTLKAGRQAHVPLLVGWNAREGSWHSLVGDTASPADYASAIREKFGPDADAVLRTLPGNDSTQVKESGDILAGAGFTALSTWRWARLAGKSGGQPVYVYLYTHPRGSNGAVHSAEIEYALGNLKTNHVYDWTADDFTVSDAMQQYFAAFIETGRPEVAALPVWPANNSPASPVMVLDVHPHVGPPSVPATWAFVDSLYAKHEH